MPRDPSGVYTLPPGYFAETGQRIQPSQHNPPLEDIAQALTDSLPRNGSAPMTSPLKGASGDATVPGFCFNEAPGSGFFRTANGIGIAVGGVQVAEFTSGGLAASTPVGGGMDFWGTTAPAGWIFPYGQAVNRVTYAALFAVMGTTYGAGDGSTTFNLPDKRDRASFAKGDMGGTPANRITNQSGGWEGDNLGAAGGAQTHTLTAAQIPAHTHPTTVNLNDPGHQHSVPQGALNQASYGNGIFSAAVQALVNTNGAQTGITVSVAVNNNTGGGGAHNNLPPGIVCNYIIFAGV